MIIYGTGVIMKCFISIQYGVDDFFNFHCMLICKCSYNLCSIVVHKAHQGFIMSIYNYALSAIAKFSAAKITLEWSRGRLEAHFM